MAPCGIVDNTITANVMIAGIAVDALVESGATTSCCGYKWYIKNENMLGAIVADRTTVRGVRNLPVSVRGRTNFLPLQWNEAETKIFLLTVPTLEGPDVILGMDISTKLGV